MTKKREINKRFKCPACGEGKLFVVNSRNRDGLVRLRRYACDSCEHRISSIEVPAGEDLGPRMDGPEANRLIMEFAFRMASNAELLAEIARRMDDTSNSDLTS